jgi:hypothetical protein
MLNKYKSETMQKKKFFNFIVLMIVPIVLSSCDSDSVALETNVDTDNRITNIIDDFRTSVNMGSRATSDIQVVSVDTKYYKIESDTVVESVPTRSDDLFFDINTVKIKVNNTNGFAVLSTDERLNKIFYFTENGNISDTMYITPLKEYIDFIPLLAAEEITNSEVCDTRATNQDILIDPIVPFKWGQSSPFNNLTPVCNCSDCQGHMPIGCVTTASAQTLATIGTFKSTYFGSKDIDFKNLPRFAWQMTSSQKSQISHFFHEVALCCQVKFECGGSGSYVKSAYQYFKDLGFSCTYKEGSIDCQQLISELQKGFPHMIGGSKGKSGHMWIVDGIKSSGSTIFFSCNWGWNGYCDGWVDGNPYTVTYNDDTTKAYSKNLRHIYIQSKPF